MPKYEVAIIENGEKIVTVDAENRKAAEAFVQKQYDQGAIAITPGVDYFDVSFLAKPSLEQEAHNIEVLFVPCGEKARPLTLMNDLESMQQTVGGLIETVYLNDDVVLICNEEGKVNGLPPNRAVYDENHRIVDVIAGDFFICTAPEDSTSFDSLSKEQMAIYQKTFGEPQKFVRTPDGVHALSVKEKNDDLHR